MSVATRDKSEIDSRRIAVLTASAIRGAERGDWGHIAHMARELLRLAAERLREQQQGDGGDSEE